MKTPDALFCAEDRSRNRVFRNAIGQAIKENKKEKIHVVDAGSGIGILGLYALIQGAATCTFIEENSDTFILSKKLIKKLGYRNQSDFLNQDATTVKLRKKYDLLVSETLSSDLESEDFFAIINHLQQFANPSYHIIPEEIIQTTTQYDEAGKVIKENTIHIQTKQGKPKATMIEKQTKKVVYHGKLVLYGEYSINSGDCISLFNKREKEIK